MNSGDTPTIGGTTTAGIVVALVLVPAATELSAELSLDLMSGATSLGLLFGVLSLGVFPLGGVLFGGMFEHEIEVFTHTMDLSKQWIGF